MTDKPIKWGIAENRKLYLKGDGWDLEFDFKDDLQKFISENEMEDSVEGPWPLEDVIQITPLLAIEFIEKYVKAQWEKKGYKNVSVGAVAPYGIDIYMNREHEMIPITVSYDGKADFTVEMRFYPLYEAAIRDLQKRIGKLKYLGPTES